MSLTLQPKNPLQTYTEQSLIGNRLNNLGVTTVNINCMIHGVQKVTTFEFRKDQVNCPECQKIEQYAYEANAFKQAKRTKALENGIAERYYGLTLSDYQVTTELQSKLIDFLKAWLASFSLGSKNIALLGSTGTGKTMLASILATEVMNKGCSVKMIRSSDIAEQVRATWKSQNRMSESDLIQAWINCDLLIIDEFGEGDIAVNAEWADQDRARLSKIIDGRYQNGKSTIITSNLDKPLFFNRLGARALDRFQQNAMLVVCSWLSYRKALSNFVELV